MPISLRRALTAGSTLLAASLASVVLGVSVPAHAAEHAPADVVAAASASVNGSITPFTPTVPNPTTATKEQLAAAAEKRGLTLPSARSAPAALAADSAVGGQISRAEVISRAKTWVDAGVPYSMTSYRTDANGTYRTDCSGFVSMAWHLRSSSANNYGETTGTLLNFTSSIDKNSLKPGDILLNPAAGANGHVVIFNGWTDSSRTSYDAYEQAGSTGAVHRTIPYPYWSGHGTFSPRRYNNIVDSNAGRTTKDLTGDGLADLAVYEKDGTITMGRGFGDGFTDYHKITSGFGEYDGRLSFADVTGDGKADLLAYEKDGTITMGEGFGDGFTNYHQITTGFGGYDGRLKFGDVTGDGKADLVAYEKDGTLTLGKSFGDGFTNYHQITTGFGGYDGRLHIVG
ncbi:FG-GAP-like repeat-containing protein [Streptomyces sp. MS2A]|nr:FG-GAP-like repeat-containing protein [Streptomyces sp. MS2A]